MKATPDPLPEDPKKIKSRANAYVRFSSMAFQMIITIGGGAWGGTALDKLYQNETPIWTIILSLSGLIISLVLVIRSANNMYKNE